MESNVDSKGRLIFISRSGINVTIPCLASAKKADYIGTMLQELLQLLEPLDWTEAPAEMGFESPYGVLLDDVATLNYELVRQESKRSDTQIDSNRQTLVDSVDNKDTLGQKKAHISAPGENKTLIERQRRAALLYLKAPGIVNVMLNYKICTEHGLPLHPTIYYELTEARKYQIDHGLPAIDLANRLYVRSIEMARRALRLEPSYDMYYSEFWSSLPPSIVSFVYTGLTDTYTWRGSNPAIIQRLAETVHKEFRPDIVVAAAHGSIMPALLLSELLAVPLYFVRFSMFKRHDEAPIVSFSDIAYLSAWKNGTALLYDEDVAGGRTLGLFAKALAPLFAQTRTACSIRHAGASFKPDFCGKTWWD